MIQIVSKIDRASKAIAVLILLILSSEELYASFDSLSEDSNYSEEQWEHHYNAARLGYMEDIDGAIVSAKRSEKIAFGLRNVELVGKSHWLTGWLCYLRGERVNAFNYYLGARKAYLKLQDWDKVEQLEENLGSVALENRSVSTAITRWRQRLKTAKKLDEKRMATAYFDLGLAYKHYRQLKASLENFVEARSLFCSYYEPKDSIALGRLYNEIAHVYLLILNDSTESGLADSVRTNLKRATEMDGSLTLQAITLHNLGEVDLLLKNYEHAIKYYREAIRINKHLDRSRLLIPNYVKIGAAFFYSNQPDSSISYLSRALDMEYNNLKNNDEDIKLKLEMNISDYMFLAIDLMDSIQQQYPRYASKSNYLSALSTINEIRLTLLQLDAQDKADLIELASKEHEEALEQEILLARIKIWALVALIILVACLLTVKLLKWYQLKSAAQAEYDRSRKSVW